LRKISEALVTKSMDGKFTSTIVFFIIIEIHSLINSNHADKVNAISIKIGETKKDGK
tara:strand:- start:5550 stop:5720 length:171 start_codon:yes stop_codon:yes gene_type:complete